MTCECCAPGIPIDKTLLIVLAERGHELTVEQLIGFGCKVYVELGAKDSLRAVQDMQTGDIIVLSSSRPDTDPE